MKSLKGTETEKNLLKAFAGESQARNRYTYFAGKARKEGYVQISDIFEETANQEKEHAKRFFKFLEGGELEISASFPAGIIGDTIDNLKAAAEGENHEHTELYPQFAEVARKEGFDEIADVFDAISIAEKQHESSQKPRKKVQANFTLTVTQQYKQIRNIDDTRHNAHEAKYEIDVIDFQDGHELTHVHLGKLNFFSDFFTNNVLNRSSFTIKNNLLKCIVILES